MSQTLKKIQSNIFVIFVFGYILFIYYANVKLVWMERVPYGFGKILYLFVFNLVFFMLMWSMLQTMYTDPGRVPLYWGYFLNDPEQKKRRYCLICHIFKPERSHHCSACNRCVLNMDHHCPWINNCVGFFNRKFFILMLIYVIVSAFVAFLGMTGEIINIFSSIHQYSEGIKNVQVFWFSDFIILVAYVMVAVALVVISLFLKFHITLILTNSSTIENLDKKRTNSKSQSANYDMGYYYNWVQVFGKNVVFWPFPIYLESGKPVGDGIVYPQKYNEEKENYLQEQQQQSSLKSPQTVRQEETNNVPLKDPVNNQLYNSSMPYGQTMNNYSAVQFQQQMPFKGNIGMQSAIVSNAKQEDNFYRSTNQYGMGTNLK